MSNFKKVLAGTAAAAALISLAAPANASITQPTLANFVSSTTAPAATVAFASTGALAIDNATAAFGAAFTSGNLFTFTLSQGTYAVLPTITPTGGGTVSYISGGAGQSQITYQITGTVTALSLAGVQVNGVTNAADAAAVNVVVSDGAGALNSTAAGLKTFNVAKFVEPYTVTYTPTQTSPVIGSTPLVDLGATAPGSRFTNGNKAVIGTATIQGATLAAGSAAVKDWSGTDIVPSSAALSVSLPSGPFTSATIAAAGCTGPAALTVTTITAGVVTFGAATAIAVPATAAPAACILTIQADGPASGTTLLGAGATSASTTVSLLKAAATAATVTAPTRTTAGALAAISYANGSVFNAGYAVGADTAYDFYVNVANGSTTGPVIITASTGGTTGTAVLNTALAANTAAIYSIATIKAALVDAGMPAATFSSAADRGQLQVVVPSGGRVTPLLLNKTNGQVVEVSRQ